MTTKKTNAKRQPVSHTVKPIVREDSEVFIDSIWKDFSEMWELRYRKPARRNGKPERICFDWYHAGYISGAIWDLE